MSVHPQSLDVSLENLAESTAAECPIRGRPQKFDRLRSTSSRVTRMLLWDARVCLTKVGGHAKTLASVSHYCALDRTQDPRTNCNRACADVRVLDLLMRAPLCHVLSVLRICPGKLAKQFSITAADVRGPRAVLAAPRPVVGLEGGNGYV